MTLPKEELLIPQKFKPQPLLARPRLPDGESRRLGLTVAGKDTFAVALYPEGELVGAEVRKVPDMQTCHITSLLAAGNVPLEEFSLKLFGELQAEHGVVT